MLSATRAMIRPSSARGFARTGARRSTHPAKSPVEQQGMGEDLADNQKKNALVPVLMGIGAASVAYIVYGEMTSGNFSRQEVQQTPRDSSQDKPAAGEKPTTGTRG